MLLPSPRFLVLKIESQAAVVVLAANPLYCLISVPAALTTIRVLPLVAYLRVSSSAALVTPKEPRAALASVGT